MAANILQRAVRKALKVASAAGEMLQGSEATDASPLLNHEESVPVTLLAVSHRVAMRRSDVVRLFRS